MKPISRDQAAIQRAHDILHFLGTGSAPPIFDESGAVACHAAHDALAWVLGFPCGQTFQGNLDGALETLRAAGFDEIDIGEPIPEDEARKRGLV